MVCQKLSRCRPAQSIFSLFLNLLPRSGLGGLHESSPDVQANRPKRSQRPGVIARAHRGRNEMAAEPTSIRRRRFDRTPPTCLLLPAPSPTQGFRCERSAQGLAVVNLIIQAPPSIFRCRLRGGSCSPFASRDLPFACKGDRWGVGARAATVRLPPRLLQSVGVFDSSSTVSLLT